MCTQNKNKENNWSNNKEISRSIYLTGNVGTMIIFNDIIITFYCNDVNLNGNNL